jgi:putative ABC transport system ATP-binding protein
MLSATRLTKQFDSGGRPLTVLRDVTFTIAQGEFVAVVGPSGSGKTTLLGLLAGLDTPSSGGVVLDGADLVQLNEDERARMRGQKVGFMFQSFQLIPSLTALENVQVPLELAPRAGGGSAQARAKEILARVGLAAREHHFPAQLSGGEQQRVALARAFVNAPRILFADEPTGNLDGRSGEVIIDLIAALNRESGATVVLVTHEARVATRASRIIRLRDGAVESDSPAGAAHGLATAPAPVFSDLT